VCVRERDCVCVIVVISVFQYRFLEISPPVGPYGPQYIPTKNLSFVSYTKPDGDLFNQLDLPTKASILYPSHVFDIRWLTKKSLN
jgi:hypothetical protein